MWLLMKVFTKWLALCLSQMWRPGLWYPRAGDMKVKEAGSLPSVELTLGMVATEGMLATLEAESMTEPLTHS